MWTTRWVALPLVLIATAGLGLASPGQVPGERTIERPGVPSLTLADSIRALERKRLRALVDADTAVANALHADDFQLINPWGQALSKRRYLGGLAAGAFDYLVWDPDSIAVRVYDSSVVIRYSSHLQIVVQGQTYPLTRYWHTDVYELRERRWQVVWSQATEIK